jgi:LytS/YehU family sensor histidine kinase
LTFAENYAYLLRERFSDAYNFIWEVPQNKLNGQMIVPVALQTLIENAVKHNAGSCEKPLQIRVKLDEHFLTVQNEVRQKPQTRPTHKTGLQNLATRYAFLTDRPVEIEQTANSFYVKLPLIRKQ